jgi:hypothetical protein
MNCVQRKYAAHLVRRQEFLKARITSQPDGDKKSFDIMEVRALQFALDCIDLCEVNNLISPITGHSL